MNAYIVNKSSCAVEPLQLREESIASSQVIAGEGENGLIIER